MGFMVTQGPCVIGGDVYFYMHQIYEYLSSDVRGIHFVVWLRVNHPGQSFGIVGTGSVFRRASS